MRAKQCRSQDAEMVMRAIREWFDRQKEEFGREIEPYQVNCGMCDELAQYVEETIDGAEMFVVEDEFPELSHISHYAIRYKGRYYDAEAPCGVDDVRELPIIKNHGNVEYHKKNEGCMQVVN
jgi:hypothetical protein